jgi:hypothetical protein
MCTAPSASFCYSSRPKSIANGRLLQSLWQRHVHLWPHVADPFCSCSRPLHLASLVMIPPEWHRNCIKYFEFYQTKCALFVRRAYTGIVILYRYSVNRYNTGIIGKKRYLQYILAIFKPLARYNRAQTARCCDSSRRFFQATLPQ